MPIFWPRFSTVSTSETTLSLAWLPCRTLLSRWVNLHAIPRNVVRSSGRALLTFFYWFAELLLFSQLLKWTLKYLLQETFPCALPPWDHTVKIPSSFSSSQPLVLYVSGHWFHIVQCSMSSLHDFSLIQFETHLNYGNHVSLTLLSLKYVVQFFAIYII